MTEWNDVRRYFETTAVAHLATLLPDGSPHTVPVWVGVDGDRVTFFSIAGSRKDRNVQADPRVAISVTMPDEPLDAAFIRGRVVERIEGDAALPIVDRISRLYTGEPYDIRSGLAAFTVAPERSWAQNYAEEG
jgi:PPOX class probable F420-dependent enzyme